MMSARSSALRRRGPRQQLVGSGHLVHEAEQALDAVARATVRKTLRLDDAELRMKQCTERLDVALAGRRHELPHDVQIGRAHV